MRAGYYFKLADKWHRYEHNNFPISNFKEVTECYFYRCDVGVWEYSEHRLKQRFADSDYFSWWTFKEPAEEDLVLLEMMFP